MKYTDLDPQSQPRRRLQEVGADALSTSELLAVALWISDTDAAGELASIYRQAGGIGRIRRDEVTKVHGLGDRYADALAAIRELIRRELFVQTDEHPTIHSPADAANLVMYEMASLEQEQLRVILLNIRNRVIRVVTLYQGSANSAQVRVGELFKDAIREQAAAIIVVHNHPSGDPTPSSDDVALTSAIVQAGKVMDIDVLDHMIIGHGRFVSLKERGLGF